MLSGGLLNVATGEHAVTDDFGVLQEWETRDSDERGQAERAATEGLLTLRDGGLFVGDDDPMLARETDEKNNVVAEIAISSNQRWASVKPDDEDVVYFVDARAKKKSVLYNGRAWGVAWLEAGIVDKLRAERASFAYALQQWRRTGGVVYEADRYESDRRK
jgi:hypothetical protein